MTLEQGQIWKKGKEYYRIVRWARTEIEFKTMTDPATKIGEVRTLSKKEFCRQLKGADLL